MSPEQIRQLYIDAIGREPNEAEIRHHIVNRTNPQHLADFLFTAPEARAERERQIVGVYRQVFGRLPNQDELQAHFENRTGLNQLRIWAETHPENINRQTQPQTGTLEPQVPVTQPQPTSPDPAPTLTPEQTAVQNLTPFEKQIIDQLKQVIDSLKKRGQVLNPSVAITPEKAAEFIKQAESEINPYYASQLKLAREGLLRGFGFSAEQIQLQEQDLERKYGKALRQIGEGAAERGFALSGIRQREERELAEEAQRGIEQGRRQLSFEAGTQARQFAQQYGAPPTFTLPAVPRAGIEGAKFTRPEGTLPMYQLSPEVYEGLIGEQEFARRGGVLSRASQLEEPFRTEEAINQARTFM